MRRSSLALVVLGVLVALAVMVGGLSGDRWTDERTVSFATSTSALQPSDLDSADGAGASFNWTMPRNATSADVVVHLYYTGQAVRGGTATVSLRFTTPDGKPLPPVTRAWAIPQGATTAETEVNATAVWAEVPHTLRDTTSSTHGVWWLQPLVLQVTVGPPSDVPLASYSFQASATGTVDTYHAR